MRSEIARKGLLGWIMSVGTDFDAPAPAEQVQDTAKRIILMTDGAHHGAIDPISVATQLKKSGVEIDCIGIFGRGKDEEEVNEELLKEIASRDEAGRPRYWHIGDRLSLISKLEELSTGLAGIGT